MNRTPEAQYTNIWQRISDNLGLGYHLHRSAVRTELDRFVRHLPSLYEMLVQSAPFLHYVVSEVEKRNMPLEIALLPFIESQFNPHISSEYGASGIWQFMPSTARHFDMEMSWWFDDRRDIINSTEIALNYLERLAQSFNGDWLLAVAAYNTGPRRVRNIQAESLKQGQPKDFWTLNLPRQTRRYVPAMIALAEVIRWGEVNGTPLPHISNRPFFTVLPLPGQIDLLSLIENTGIELETFFRLNAGFKQWAPNPERPAHILLPLELVSAFRTDMQAGRGPLSVNWVTHLVRPGDTLGKIAALFGCKISTLRQLNGVLARNAHLDTGRYLLVPSGPVPDLIPRGGLTTMTMEHGDTMSQLSQLYGISEAHLRLSAGLKEGSNPAPGQQLVLELGPAIPETSIGKRSAFYKARAGDTLTSIASRFNTSVSELMQLNDKSSSSLYPGTKIRIPLQERP